MIKANEKVYIGIGLGKLREKKGWTQEYIVDNSILSYRTVQNIEYNISSPSSTSLQALADVFEMKFSEFMSKIETDIIHKVPERKKRKKVDIEEQYDA